jgi:hypothetical protein
MTLAPSCRCCSKPLACVSGPLSCSRSLADAPNTMATQTSHTIPVVFSPRTGPTGSAPDHIRPATHKPTLVPPPSLLPVFPSPPRQRHHTTPLPAAARPGHPATMSNDSKWQIFIGNVSSSTTDDRLRQVFSTVGHVVNVRVMTDRGDPKKGMDGHTH